MVGRVSVDKARRDAMIQQYKEGYSAVVDALQGITDAELDARPSADEWSPRHIIHHLADSEMTAAIRLRRLLNEDNPTIEGYDQEHYARQFYYRLPVEQALEAFRAARSSTAPILDAMSDDQWDRAGTHSEHGRYSVQDLMEVHAGHAHLHAEQIRAARKAER